MDIFKSKLKDSIKDCKNFFLNKKVILLSCGPSIEKYKYFIDYYRDKDTLLVVIKTATHYSNFSEDIFFYDPRIYLAHRTDFKYSLNDITTPPFFKPNGIFKKYPLSFVSSQSKKL